MRYQGAPVTPRQGRASNLPPVDAAAQPAHTSPDEYAAKLALQRARNLVTQASKEKFRRRLRHLDRDVADEAVGDDHVHLACVEILGLDVTHEALHGSFQPAGGLL